MKLDSKQTHFEEFYLVMMKRLILHLPLILAFNYDDIHHKRGIPTRVSVNSRKRRDLNERRGETLRYLELSSNDEEFSDTFDADFDEENENRFLRRMFVRSNITDGESCENFRLCATNKLVLENQ